MIKVLLPKEYDRNDVSPIIKLFCPSEDIIFSEHQASPKSEPLLIKLETKGDVHSFEASVRITIRDESISSYVVSMNTLTFFDESDLSKRKITLKHALFKTLSSYYGFHPGYGILTGVRPVKLVRMLSEKGFAVSFIRDILQHTFLLTEEIIINLLDVYAVEKKVIHKHKSDIHLYIGIPFCPSICHYCSFGSYQYKNEKALDDYLDILVEEMKLIGDIIADLSLKIKTIYVGGGTPSILNEKQLERFFTAIHQFFGFECSAEFTFEAGRPDTINETKLRLMKTFGVNRISINPQTMNNDTLRRVGRHHTAEDLERAFEQARRISFKTINMDFINGLPGETLQDAEANMACVDRLAPENVTIHSLSIKRGSDFHKKNYVNMIHSKNIEQSENFYRKHLLRSGRHIYYLYRQKNIMNNSDNCGYAFSGHEGLYNINIIEEIQTVLALGAGATTKIVDQAQIIRLSNNKDIKTYADKLSRNTLQIKKIMSRILTD